MLDDVIGGLLFQSEAPLALPALAPSAAAAAVSGAAAAMGTVASSGQQEYVALGPEGGRQGTAAAVGGTVAGARAVLADALQELAEGGGA